MSDMNTKDFLIGTLIGGIVGASAALLLAPKSGKELRHDISEQAQIAKDKTTQLTNNALEKGNAWASTAKEKSSNIIKTVSEQSEKVIGKMKEVSDGIKEDVNRVRSSAEDFVADDNNEQNNTSEITEANVQQEVERLHQAITEETNNQKEKVEQQ